MAAYRPPFVFLGLWRWRREIRLTVIDTIRGDGNVWRWSLRGINADFDGVDEAVANGRCERQAVLVTDDLRDLRVYRVELLCVRGEISPPSGSFGESFQEQIGLFELLRGLAGVCCARFLFARGLRILQTTRQRNSQEAHVARF